MDNQNYLSPFSWRYGSDPLRKIWSEYHKRLLWRKIWVALAEVQAEYGIVAQEQAADLASHAEKIDIERSLEIENEIHHDLMAEIKSFAEQSPVGAGIIHLGATSADIQENADALRIRQSLELIQDKLSVLLSGLADKVEDYADLTVMAHTHIQPAEPTTFGYRLSVYGQDLLADWEEISRIREGIKGKGFKGAVGTNASYADLLGTENLAGFEDKMRGKLNLEFYPIATQTSPRKQELRVINALAGIGSSLYKFALDIRILQSPPFGEISEPFQDKQVGSSAMPFKRNPINAEKVDSLSRALAQMPRLAWDNAANSILERTLDDSANRRTLLPETFLISDELLIVAEKIIKNLQINQTAIDKNLEIYGPFAATERVLMALVKKGADRQEMHELIREQALKAWEALQKGQPNPLKEMIVSEEEFLAFLSRKELSKLMDARDYTGDAPQRAKAFAQRIRESIPQTE